MRSGPQRQVGHRLHVVHEAQPGQCLHRPPARVRLSPAEAHARRAGISVVVVVPRLAHAHEGEPARVAALLRALGQLVGLLSFDVAHVVDEPEAILRERQSHEDTPDHPCGAAHRVQRERERHLEPEARALQGEEEGVILEVGVHGGIEARVARMPRAEEGVRHRAEEAVAVAEVLGAVGLRLVLVEVAQEVHAAHAEDAAQPRQRAEEAECPLHHARCAEGAVDEAAVDAHRETETHGHPGQHGEDRHRAPREAERSADECAHMEQGPPEHLARVPPCLAPPRDVRVHAPPLSERGQRKHPARKTRA